MKRTRYTEEPIAYALREAIAAQRVERIEAGAANECWLMDFASDALYDGRLLRILTVVDNWPR